MTTSDVGNDSIFHMDEAILVVFGFTKTETCANNQIVRFYLISEFRVAFSVKSMRQAFCGCKKFCV